MLPSTLWGVYSSDPKCLALVGVKLACSTSMTPLMQFLDLVLAHTSLSGKKHLGPFGAMQDNKQWPGLLVLVVHSQVSQARHDPTVARANNVSSLTDQ